MPVQVTLSGKQFKRGGSALGRIVVLALALVLAAFVVRVIVVPRDGLVSSIPSSHYASISTVSGTTYYAHLHRVSGSRFVKLTSVHVLAQQTDKSGKASGLGIETQHDTLVNSQQIVAVVDIGANPAVLQ